jgi:hypothetical protein
VLRARIAHGLLVVWLQVDQRRRAAARLRTGPDRGDGARRDRLAIGSQKGPRVTELPAEAEDRAVPEDCEGDFTTRRNGDSKVGARRVVPRLPHAPAALERHAPTCQARDQDAPRGPSGSLAWDQNKQRPRGTELTVYIGRPADTIKNRRATRHIPKLFEARSNEPVMPELSSKLTMLPETPVSLSSPAAAEST